MHSVRIVDNKRTCCVAVSLLIALAKMWRTINKSDCSGSCSGMEGGQKLRGLHTAEDELWQMRTENR